MQVDGNVGDVFYCYNKSDEGWYKVNSDHHAVRITEGEARGLNVDVGNPPALKQYWLFTLDSKGSGNGGGVDLQHFSGWLGSQGNLLSEENVNELAEHGTLNGQKVSDQIVLDTAKRLHENDNALFHKIDQGTGTATGNGDGIIAPWDITAALLSGQVKSSGEIASPTDTEYFSNWLGSNGSYISAAELKELAENGNFKGKPVDDQRVRQAAIKLHENNDYLFNRIDANSPGFIDHVIAPWDIAPAPIPGHA
jgi:hypothetical protein